MRPLPRLPRGCQLPDGTVVRQLAHGHASWQILSTDGGGRALVADASMAEVWIARGLLAPGQLTPFGLEGRALAAMSCGPGQRIEPVMECASPQSKAEAIAFAQALRATRGIDPTSPLQDAIYLEPASRLLPVPAGGRPDPDELVLGRWLTGGLPIGVDSFARLCQALSWLAPDDVAEILRTAGLDPPDMARELASRDAPGATVRKSVASAGNGAAPPGQRPPFELPGRRVLEAFFREHVLDIVDHPDRYGALGIEFPSAILLHGPPGCGKTFAVRRLIEHLGWASFEIDASSVASPYIHETSRKVAQVFAEAEDHAPAALVIDEMDAFLARREAAIGQHHVEEVAEFLRRIPIAASRRVLVIAMTNRLDLIDPAILRRGRFDHVIAVELAGEGEVRALLDHVLQGLPVADDVDTAALACELVGRPLSDVSFVVREGARLAARDGQQRIQLANLLTALHAAPARTGGGLSHRIGFV